MKTHPQHPSTTRRLAMLAAASALAPTACAKDELRQQTRLQLLERLARLEPFKSDPKILEWAGKVLSQVEDGCRAGICGTGSGVKPTQIPHFPPAPTPPMAPVLVAAAWLSGLSLTQLAEAEKML